MTLSSKQFQIITRVRQIIETINPDEIDAITSEAYDIDLSQAVFVNRAVLGENDPVPAVTILENPKPIPTEFLQGERRDHPQIEWMTLLVQGFARKEKDEHGGKAAYTLKALVEQALSRVVAPAEKGRNGGLYPADYMLGTVNGKYLVNDFTIQTGGVRPPTNGVSPTAFFYLPLVVKFTFNPSNPYV